MAAIPTRCRATAIGYLELLWHFTSEYAPQGDIGRYSDERIEAALYWSGRPGKLLEALANSRWIDRDDHARYIVHHWEDHADASVMKRLQRAGLSFVRVSGKMAVLPCHAMPEPQPQPQPQRSSPPSKPAAQPEQSADRPITQQLGSHPKTAAAVRSKFATADLSLITKIASASVAAWLNVPGPKIPDPTDELIAAAVDQAYAEAGKRQTSPGLFLRIVPQVIQSWAEHGRKSAADDLGYDPNDPYESIVKRKLNLGKPAQSENGQGVYDLYTAEDLREIKRQR